MSARSHLESLGEPIDESTYSELVWSAEETVRAPLVPDTNPELYTHSSPGPSAKSETPLIKPPIILQGKKGKYNKGPKKTTQPGPSSEINFGFKLQELLKGNENPLDDTTITLLKEWDAKEGSKTDSVCEAYLQFHHSMGKDPLPYITGVLKIIPSGHSALKTYLRGLSQTIQFYKTNNQNKVIDQLGLLYDSMKVESKLKEEKEKQILRFSEDITVQLNKSLRALSEYTAIIETKTLSQSAPASSRVHVPKAPSVSSSSYRQRTNRIQLDMGFDGFFKSEHNVVEIEGGLLKSIEPITEVGKTLCQIFEFNLKGPAVSKFLNLAARPLADYLMSHPTFAKDLRGLENPRQRMNMCHKVHSIVPVGPPQWELFTHE